MMALQSDLEKEFLGEEPLPMSLKRGRKPGSKVKKQKDGSRVVVTGRAAAALLRREGMKKEKAKTKKAATKAKKALKPVKDADAKPKRKPGRPRKDATAPQQSKRVVRRRRSVPSIRTGVIA